MIIFNKFYNIIPRKNYYNKNNFICYTWSQIKSHFFSSSYCFRSFALSAGKFMDACNVFKKKIQINNWFISFKVSTQLLLLRQINKSMQEYLWPMSNHYAILIILHFRILRNIHNDFQIQIRIFKLHAKPWMKIYPDNLYLSPWHKHIMYYYGG